MVARRFTAEEAKPARKRPTPTKVQQAKKEQRKQTDKQHRQERKSAAHSLELVSSMHAMLLKGPLTTRERDNAVAEAIQYLRLLQGRE